MQACKTRGVWGMLPQEIRCSEKDILVNSRASEITIYLRTYLRVPFSAVAKTTYASIPRWSSMNEPA